MGELIDRRRFLWLAAGGTAAVAAACGSGTTAKLVRSTDPAVREVESTRQRSGRDPVAVTLTAAPVAVDLAGRVVQTWAYGSHGGTPEIRVRRGDTLHAKLVNQLPQDTTIHWHGIALRNDMDGVHDLTQAPVKPGAQFVYQFTVPDPGTYFFHPHVALQLDRGLYAPLVVEDPDDPVQADVDQVLVLDDWLDGIDGTPEDALARLKTTMRGMGGSSGSGGMGGMDMGNNGSGGMGGMNMMQSSLLGGDAGDITYPLYLINGRPPADRPTVTAAPGARVRLRIINAGSDTAFRFAIGGHRLTVTHADGFPVDPVEVDALLMGMGERYDVIVKPASGAWPVVALPEGKTGRAIAVLRTTDAAAASAPPEDAQPAEMNGRILAYTDLRPTSAAVLPARKASRSARVELTGNMMSYQWGIAGKAFPKSPKVEVREGERIRIELVNRSPMWHPMHLHGHTFALAGSGVRKDTVNVLPGKTQTVELDADNPGQWMLHCHNTYHLESGMATVMSYIR